MYYSLASKNEKFSLLAILLAFIVIELDHYLLIGGLAVIFILAFRLTKSQNIILAIIFALLVITSDVNETLRITLTFASLIYLIYQFLSVYGIGEKKIPSLPAEVFWYILFAIIIMIISSAASSNLISGLNETLRQAAFFILWYLLFTFIKKDEDAFNYAGILVSAGVISAIIIIYIFITTDLSIFLLQTKGVIHEGGSFKNVTAAGGIFAVSIPLNIIFLLLSISSQNKFKYLFYLVLFVQVFGLILTNSRSGILAVSISTGIILYFLKKKALKKFLLSLTTTILILYFVLPTVSDLFAIYFRVDRILENTRFYLWDMSLNIILDNPIFGTGPGQFKEYMYNHLPVMLGSWEEGEINWIYKYAGLGESHNFILFRTAELGILGLVSAIILPVIFLFINFKVLRQNRSNKKNYHIVVGIFALGIGMFIRSFFESTGLLSHGWIIRDLPFWICFAIITFFYVNRVSNTDEC